MKADVPDMEDSHPYDRIVIQHRYEIFINIDQDSLDISSSVDLHLEVNEAFQHTSKVLRRDELIIVKEVGLELHFFFGVLGQALHMMRLIEDDAILFGQESKIILSHRQNLSLSRFRSSSLHFDHFPQQGFNHSIRHIADLQLYIPCIYMYHGRSKYYGICLNLVSSAKERAFSKPI